MIDSFVAIERAQAQTSQQMQFRSRKKSFRILPAGGSLVGVMRDRDDQSLMREFAVTRSEGAFSELARRHGGLVFGVAMRKLGDASWAEEVSQSVFTILARKAALLCHREDLSGWLHQTTLLECRHQLRTELRRRRREEMAMRLHDESNAANAALLEEIDDALADLAEKDRQPLLLRFFESRSLREVGAALGIGEDAAQKRVAKSLGLLERVLKRRGRDISGAALAAFMAESAVSAPAALVPALTQAALAGSVSAGIGAVAFAKFMALTKTQTAAICALIAAAPIVLETQNLRAESVRRAVVESQIQNGRRSAAGESSRREKFSAESATMEEANRAATLRLLELRAQATARPARNFSPDIYRWSESAEFVRLPKSVLSEVDLTARQEQERRPVVDKEGTLTPVIAEALGMSAGEQGGVTAAFRNFAETHQSIAEQRTYMTNAMPRGISFKHNPEELVTFVTPAFPEEGAMLREQLQANFEQILGSERAEILFRQASRTFDGDFLEFGQRANWIAVAPHDNGLFSLGRSTIAAEGYSVGSSVTQVPFERLPERFKPLMEKYRK